MKLACLLVFAGIIATSYSLTCHQCGGANQKKCGTDEGVMTCTAAAGPSQERQDFCIKEIKPDNTITKKCKTDLKTYNNKCIEQTDKSKICFCGTDKCNSSSTLVINTTSFIGMLLFILLSPKFLN